MQRTRKAITRLLAVLAVVAAFIAIYVVVLNGTKSSGDGKGRGNQPTKQAGKGKSNGKPKKQIKTPATYKIKEGDTLQAIAGRYGLRVSTILGLNPEIDAQSLAVGAKLKLR